MYYNACVLLKSGVYSSRAVLFFLSDKHFYDPHTNLIVLSPQRILLISIINLRTLRNEDNAKCIRIYLHTNWYYVIQFPEYDLIVGDKG